MKAALAALALAAALPARAEFSTQEKDELNKLLNARISIGVVANRAGATLPQFGAANRGLYANVFQRSQQAFVYCSVSLAAFANSGHGSGPSPAQAPPELTRPQFVARALQFLDSCESEMERLSSAVAALATATGSTLNGAMGVAQNAQAALSSFDRSLPYVDYQLASYPSIATPHGDLDAVMFHLARSSLYVEQVWSDLNAVFASADVMPAAGFDQFSRVIRDMTNFVNPHTTIWGMDFNHVLDPDDANKIAFDQAAGNNLRPPSFWLENRKLELNLSRCGNRFPPLNSGRSVDCGMGAALTTMGRHAADFLRVVFDANADNPAEIRSLLAPTFESYADHTDAWGDTDALGFAYIGLFHDFPSAPPGSGSCPQGQVCMLPPEPVECPDQQVQFLAISPSGRVSAVCVAP